MVLKRFNPVVYNQLRQASKKEGNMRRRTRKALCSYRLPTFRLPLQMTIAYENSPEKAEVDNQGNETRTVVLGREGEEIVAMI